jgi:predicted heme/steroid binding protein
MNQSLKYNSEEYTLEIEKKDIKKYNGQEGQPAYVAAEGEVYDVSDSRLWKNGVHMNRHHAGQDLTNEFGAAPHGTEVLQKFQKVGNLKESTKNEQQLPIPKWIAHLLNLYPFLKRHPHPMVVHFPMVYYITAPILLFWFYLIDTNESLIKAVFYMHVLGTISLPFAILTGWLSWKVNYLGKPIGYIKRKIMFTVVVLIFDVIVLISLSYQPEILISPHGLQIIIPVLVFSYLPIISIIGHHGGQLVY